MEELELYLEIGLGKDPGSTLIEGLVLEGAGWRNPGGLHLSNELRETLPCSRLRWSRRCERPVGGGSMLSLPVYLDESRSALVVDVLLEQPPGVSKHVWAQRGTAFILQSTI